MLVIPPWGLWLMFAASAAGVVMLGLQLRQVGWGLRALSGFQIVTCDR